MSDADTDDSSDDDVFRWFVGGSPPEADSWPRHAFENAWHHGSAFATAVDERAFDRRHGRD